MASKNVFSINKHGTVTNKELMEAGGCEAFCLISRTNNKDLLLRATEVGFFPGPTTYKEVKTDEYNKLVVATHCSVGYFQQGKSKSPAAKRVKRHMIYVCVWMLDCGNDSSPGGVGNVRVYWRG